MCSPTSDVHGGRGAGIAKGAEILGWVKAEGRGASQGSGMAPVPCGSKGLRGIFDDHELVGGGNCVKGVSIHTLAVEMHGHDAFEIGWMLIGNRVLDRERREVEGRRVNVGEDRAGAAAGDGAGRGKERKRRGDEGVTGGDANRCESEPQGIRTRGAADRGGRAEMRRNFALQGRNLLAQHQRLRFADLVDGTGAPAHEW